MVVASRAFALPGPNVWSIRAGLPTNTPDASPLLNGIIMGQAPLSFCAQVWILADVSHKPFMDKDGFPKGLHFERDMQFWPHKIMSHWNISIIDQPLVQVVTKLAPNWDEVALGNAASSLESCVAACGRFERMSSFQGFRLQVWQRAFDEIMEGCLAWENEVARSLFWGTYGDPPVEKHANMV